MAAITKRLAVSILVVPCDIAGHRAGVYGYTNFEDSGSYYNYIHQRQKLAQIAFDSELGEKWRIEMGYQFYKGNLPQNVGWNRITQALIDNGTYLAGSPLVNLSTNGYNITPANLQRDSLQTFVFTPNFAPVFQSAAYAQTAALFALNPATVHLTHLNDNQIIADAGDFSNADTDTGYFDIVRDIREGFTFKNQTFVETLDASKYTNYEFSSYYNPKVFENKTTVDYQLKPTSWATIETTSGFAARHTQFYSGESRTPQANDRRDLSVGPTPNDRFAGAFTPYAINSWDYFQQGSYSDIGEFFLTDIKLWSQTEHFRRRSLRLLQSAINRNRCWRADGSYQRERRRYHLQREREFAAAASNHSLFHLRHVELLECRDRVEKSTIRRFRTRNIFKERTWLRPALRWR